MKKILCLHVMLVVLVVVFTGCANRSAEAPKGDAAKNEEPLDAEATIRASLDRLSPEDRKLAEAQGYCPIEKNPLGSMGVPHKVMVNDQPVLLCCDACETLAKAHADRTLAKVQQLKEKRAAPPETK